MRKSELGDDQLTRRRVTIRWPDRREGPWVVRLQFAPVRGRIECVGLELRSHQEPGERLGLPSLDESNDERRILHASLLRKLPLGKLIDEAREEWLERLRRHRKYLAAAYTQTTQERLDRAVTLYEERRRGGRKGYGVDHFAEVAEVYLRGGSTPTRAVAKHFYVTRSAAAKWVARARQLGLLEPTTKGKVSGRESAPKRKGRKRQ